MSSMNARDVARRRRASRTRLRVSSSAAAPAWCQTSGRERRGSSRERRRHDCVQDAPRPGCRRTRAGAARPRAARKRARPRRVASDLAAHGIADARARRMPRGKLPGKRFEHASRERARAGDCVMPATAFCSWMTQRPAREPRRNAARTRDEAAQRRARPRPATAQRAQRLRERARRAGTAPRARSRTPLPRKPADADPFDVDVLRRHDARFEPALRAEPHDARSRARAAPRATASAGKHMTAGAARHDQDGRRAHRTHPRVGTSRPLARHALVVDAQQHAEPAERDDHARARRS